MTPPTDRRWLWWLPFLSASAVFSAWASFTSQQLLGALMNWQPAWLMPAILDNLVIGTAVAFILLPGWATWATSVAVLAVSALANAQAHYYDPRAADLGIPTGWAIFWSVLPLAAMFTIEHFIVATRRTRVNRTELVEPADSRSGHPAPGPSDSRPLVAAVGRPEQPDTNTDGLRDSTTGSRRPTTRRRPTKTASSRGARAGRPNGPPVEAAAAEIRRLGLNNPQQAMDTLGIGTAKARHPVVVAALTANNNGH